MDVLEGNRGCLSQKDASNMIHLLTVQGEDCPKFQGEMKENTRLQQLDLGKTRP